MAQRTSLKAKQSLLQAPTSKLHHHYRRHPCTYSISFSFRFEAEIKEEQEKKKREAEEAKARKAEFKAKMANFG